MHAKRLTVIIALALAGIFLLSFTAQASPYTWTGINSNDWATSGNWNVSGFPNAYTDTATIPYLATRPTVSLSTLALLGGGGTALTISNKSTGTTVNALDITGSGTLGMQGGISIGTRRTLTIEGILRNDAASSATSYNIAGTTILNGGTISSLNGGIWNFSNGVTGNGTISAPFSLNGGVVSATGSGQTLHITGNVTTNVQRGLGGNIAGAAGNLLSIEGGTITAGPGINNGIDNYNNVDLRGTFNGIYLYLDGSGTYNLRGDSTWNGGYLNTMYFNGHKLDVNGTVGNYGSVHVDSGTLNNPGAALATIGNGNFIYLAGGSITGAPGSNGFAFATNLRGYGTISTPVTINASGSLAVNGGTLAITNTTLNNVGGATISNASDGTVHVTNSTANWGNFVNNGALISDPSTQTFNNLTVGAGTGAYIQAAAGDKYQVKGDFINNSTQNTSWNTSAAELDFIAPGSFPANNHNFALAGVDMGQNFSGYTDNFAWGTLKLDPGQTLALSDGNTTNASTALYVGEILGLDIIAGVVADITGNGFNVYYNSALNPDLLGLTYSLTGGGFLEPVPASVVPVPPSLLMLGSGLFGLGAYARRKRSLA